MATHTLTPPQKAEIVDRLKADADYMLSLALRLRGMRWAHDDPVVLAIEWARMETLEVVKRFEYASRR